MKLSNFIGKTVEVDGVSKPVILKDVDGQAVYINDKGEAVTLGRLSDSVGKDSSSVKVRLSRITG